MAHPYASQHKASVKARLGRLTAKAGKSWGAASMETSSSYPSTNAGTSRPMTIAGGTRKRADRAAQKLKKGGSVKGKAPVTNIVIAGGGGGGRPRRPAGPGAVPVPVPVPVGGARPPAAAPPPGPPGGLAGPPGPPGPMGPMNPMAMAGGPPPGGRPPGMFKRGGSIKRATGGDTGDFDPKTGEDKTLYKVRGDLEPMSYSAAQGAMGNAPPISGSSKADEPRRFDDLDENPLDLRETLVPGGDGGIIDRATGPGTKAEDTEGTEGRSSFTSPAPGGFPVGSKRQLGGPGGILGGASGTTGGRGSRRPPPTKFGSGSQKAGPGATGVTPTARPVIGRAAVVPPPGGLSQGYNKGGKVHSDEKQDKALFNKMFKAKRASGGFVGKGEGSPGPVWHNQGKGYDKGGAVKGLSAGGPASSGVRRAKQSKSAAHITNREG